MTTQQQYSPNNLPLGVMMLTGGVAGSIAEVTLCRYLDPHHPLRHCQSAPANPG